MSAASAPKPSEPSEPASDADGWALLEALRRRLDEQVNLGRKTQAQVGQLADSIAALVAQQRRRSLWLNVNSFVAYLMFTLLCVTGFYLLYRSRASELSSARDQAIDERDAAVRRADEAVQRAVAREAAGNKAWEVYELLEAGKRADAAAKLEALRDQPLTRTERAVLAGRLDDARTMEADAAIKAAAAQLKTGRPAGVSADMIAPLEAALAGEPLGPRAAQLHYYLGLGYARSEIDKSINHFLAAIAAGVNQDDARFQLASVLDRRGNHAQARAEYDKFATAHPQSPQAAFATRRAAALARMPAMASPGAPGAAAGSGAPAASPAAPGAPAVPPGSAAPGSTAPAVRPATPAVPAVRPAIPAAPVRPPAAGAAPSTSWIKPPARPGDAAQGVPPRPPAAKPATPEAAAPPAAPPELPIDPSTAP